MTLPRKAAGAVLSTEPLITISKREPDLPMGIASLRPELFERRAPGLHFIGLTWSGEERSTVEQIAKDYDDIGQRLPKSKFVMLCNTEHESFLFSRAGIPNLFVNELVFIDERVFVPIPDQELGSQRFDAVYTARLVPHKRHELASRIQSLALMYGFAYGADYDRTRALLPHAFFANHDMSNGELRKLTQQEAVATINRGRVGLCLSPVEGPMRASMEYMLCGLPVVSTRAVGGRERYLIGPHARIVEDDPEAVAAAVRELKALNLDKRAVRGYVGDLVGFDRHNFLLNVNKVVEREMGLKDHYRSFAPFVRHPVKWRLLDDVYAPLLAA